MRSAAARQARQSDWRARLAQTVVQEPLFETGASLESLRRMGRPARTVFLGVGLCARVELSKAVPLDLLGMVLPAELVRRALGAGSLCVLIADRHALANGFPAAAVEQRARAAEAVVQRIAARCRMGAISIVRASSFHDAGDYRAVLEKMRQGPLARHHEYVLRQLADAAYLERELGPLLKVGWALPGAQAFRQRDERAFDGALPGALGDRVGFVYCKPGRTLSNASPRMPPYVVKHPEARLCLDRRDDVASKLATAARQASPQTFAAHQRHLRRLVYSYNRWVEPLPHGPIEARIGQLIARLGPPS